MHQPMSILFQWPLIGAEGFGRIFLAYWRHLFCIACIVHTPMLNAEGVLTPRLHGLHNAQQDALRYEQHTDTALLPPPPAAEKQYQLSPALRRQTIHLRQLQHLQNQRAIVQQQRVLRQHERLPNENAASRLEYFRRQQEADRLHYKLQRRSWPHR